MESIWEGKTKPRRPSKHILAGQLLKTTWISNRGFPWNNNSKSFNGQRHPDLISAADQMPCKQETADTQLSPITYSALSMKGLLFTASKLISSSALFAGKQPLLPLEGKRQSWVCALCSSPKEQSWHVWGCPTYTVSARMFSSTSTGWKATKRPMANLGSDNIFLEHVT